jgi:hypothetical protein
MPDDVSTIPEIQPDEAKRLREAGVETTRDLWKRLGKDPEHGLAQLAQAAGIPRERLLDLLQRLTLHEADHCAEPWLVRHTADLLLALIVVALVLLVVRATNRPPWRGTAWAVTPRVPVAARSIARGETIRVEDVTFAPLPFQRPYFTEAEPPVGTIADRPIGRLHPFRVTDMLRAQVVATRDLPPRIEIPVDGVALAWTPYDGRALVDLELAIRRKPAEAIRKGQVLIPMLLQASP